MSFFLAALIGGFAGSFHCVGMCGGFACGLSQLNRGSRFKLIRKNMLYNSGRLISYIFIGALAGAIGAKFVGMTTATSTVGPIATNSHGLPPLGMVMAGDLGAGQRLLSVTAGILMIVMALQLLGIKRHLPASWGRVGGVAFARALQSLIQSNRAGAAITLGVANGFLPCPLVFAFAAIAAASANVAHGSIIMLGFGLGTFPAMFFISGIAFALSPVIRLRGVRIAGGFVLAMGLLTITRGVAPDMLHLVSHSMHM